MAKDFNAKYINKSKYWRGFLIISFKVRESSKQATWCTVIKGPEQANSELQSRSCGSQGPAGGRNGGWPLCKNQIAFVGGENIVKLGCGDGCTILNPLKKKYRWTVHIVLYVNFISIEPWFQALLKYEAVWKNISVCLKPEGSKGSLMNQSIFKKKKSCMRRFRQWENSENAVKAKVWFFTSY